MLDRIHEMSIATIDFFGRPYQIYNPGPGRVGSKLQYNEPYEKQLLMEIYHDHHTGTAFDIGAHIGNHTLWLALVCDLDVYAWEPHQESFDMLVINLTLNAELQRPGQVVAFNWAAGDTDTYGRFTRDMWLEFDPSRDGDKIKLDRGDIPIHPIDDALDVPDLSVVKVDVEGMEPHVLRGLIRHLRRSKPVVYAETHTQKARALTGDVLAPLGYKMVKTIEMGSPMDRWEV